MQVDVIEKNPGGYLSAAEIPLSHLYIGMAGVFFTAAMVWVYILMKHRYSDYSRHTGWNRTLIRCRTVNITLGGKISYLS